MSAPPSYLGAFLKHPTNRTALLAAGCAAILASIPMGWDGIALVGVLALGTEALAALLVPSLPSFQASVDRARHTATRALRQAQLLEELKLSGNRPTLAAYKQMCSRVTALQKTAGNPGTTLTLHDVDKLEDLTVDYLGLSTVYMSLQQRKDAPSEAVLAKRIADLQAQLQNTSLPEDEARPLRTALAEYTDALQRARRLAVRRSALEAMLLSMPDKVEEVYQLVITSPYATDMGSKLEDSLARLRMAEAVAAEFDTPDPLAYEPLYRATAPQAAQNAARTLKV